MTKKTPSFFNLSVKPWGLCTAAGVVACVATALGFLGRISWFLDLFSHFRVQYFLGLLLLSVFLLVGRRRRTATVFLILASVNLAVVLPLYFGKPNTPGDASPAMRAMLLNVNTRLGDAARVRSVVVDADPDILVLEEISVSWMSDLTWLTNSYPYSLAQPREDNFGIGLFSKLSLAEAEVVYIGDAEVPSIVATLIVAHTNLRVIATHPLPPGGRDYSRWRNDQLEKLPDYVQSPLPTLLLGDLNVTPWNYHFRRLLARTGLRDSAKGFGVQPTWPNFNPLLRIPIDHCLHSEDIVILDRRVGEDVSSDHFPVIVDFVIGEERTTKGPTR
jgi:endonuclease/exonuclease/phosphatase (EEP) superfamily protein YafD